MIDFIRSPDQDDRRLRIPRGSFSAPDAGRELAEIVPPASNLEMNDRALGKNH